MTKLDDLVNLYKKQHDKNKTGKPLNKVDEEARVSKPK